jgi:hypothetical protein
MYIADEEGIWRNEKKMWIFIRGIKCLKFWENFENKFSNINEAKIFSKDLFSA